LDIDDGIISHIISKESIITGQRQIKIYVLGECNRRGKKRRGCRELSKKLSILVSKRMTS
jgi:hypothetical protein